MANPGGVLKSLEGYSVGLFFVAAGLMVVTVGLFATEVVMDRSMDTLLGLFAPAGFGAAFLGVLGLYPRLAERSPRLAGAGALALAIGVAGAIILVAGHIGQLAGIVESQPAWVTAANLPLLFGGIILGFGTFAVGGLRTDAYSQAVALLMLWPVVVFGIGLIVVGTFVLQITYPHWVHVVHSGSEALVYLGIGYLVRTGHTPPDRAESLTDSPA